MGKTFSEVFNFEFVLYRTFEFLAGYFCVLFKREFGLGEVGFEELGLEVARSFFVEHVRHVVQRAPDLLYTSFVFEFGFGGDFVGFLVQAQG